VKHAMQRVRYELRIFFGTTERHDRVSWSQGQGTQMLITDGIVVSQFMDLAVFATCRLLIWLFTNDMPVCSC
jgi:hypothetical protein